MAKALPRNADKSFISAEDTAPIPVLARAKKEGKVKRQEMLDTNMLILMGLLDHPSIIDLEKKRIAYNKKVQEIEEMAERLMGIDDNLDDLLLAIAMVNEKEGAKE